MTITLNFSSLYEVVARTLSIVGKRSTDDKGNRIFTDITLGTNEKEIISDYFRQAAIDLSAETSAFITSSGGTTSAPTITLTFPDNHNPQLETFIQKSCDAYCVSFALWCWLTIVAPRIAERYMDDCKRQTGAIIRLLYDKTPPVTSVSFNNPSGAVVDPNTPQPDPDPSDDDDEPNT